MRFRLDLIQWCHIWAIRHSRMFIIVHSNIMFDTHSDAEWMNRLGQVLINNRVLCCLIKQNIKTWQLIRCEKKIVKTEDVYYRWVQSCRGWFNPIFTVLVYISSNNFCLFPIYNYLLIKYIVWIWIHVYLSYS